MTIGSGRARARWIVALTTSAASVAIAAAAPAQPPTSSPVLQVELKPGPPNPAGHIDTLSVTVQEPVGQVAAGQPLLRAPLIISNVQTSAASVQDLQAADAAGPVPLSFKDDPTSPEPYRRWTASRAVQGPLTIRYHVPISDSPNPRGAAPPLELRSDTGTLSGLLGVFLLAPDADTPVQLALRWNLEQAAGELGVSALGVSTLGVGDVESAKAQSPKQLETTYVMGGAMRHEPERPAKDGFFSAWQGAPPFDAGALMRWTHTLYDFDLTFFRSGDASYNVFLRPNPINAGGGVEVGGSFVGTFDQHTDPAQFQLTLAHEMVHTFVGSLDDSDGLDGSWYSEGLAVYYQRVLPLRAGLIDRKTFVRDLNDTAGRYYTDLLNTTPNSGIAARFWPDTRVRVLPYDRGALYFAEVDAAVRKASHGKRSLDDLVLEMLSRRRAGKQLSQTDWLEVATRELGAAGRAQFDAMMAGQLVLPPSDAFGACFQRTTAPLRRYELGFTPDVLIEPNRIVRGLVPGSAAERAGLRNGDRIAKPVPQDMIQSDQHALLNLEIARGDEHLHISYLPRGETVQAYQWTLSPTCAERPRKASRPKS